MQWRILNRQRWATAALLLCLSPGSLAKVEEAQESHQRIASVAKAYVASRHPWRQLQTEVTADRLDPRTRLNECPVQPEAFLPPGASIKRRSTVGVRCPAGRPWKIYVPVTVSAYAKVMVSRHPIAPGQSISDADVSWSKRDITTLGYGYLASLEGAGGYRSRHSIAQGAVITPNMVEAASLIQKGQRVQLNSQLQGISVGMAGVALQSGALGARIRVKNLSSGKQLEGIVDTDHSVVIQ